MKPTNSLPLETARKLLIYDPQSGKLRWHVRRSQRCPAGAEAGSVHPSGYRFIQIAGVSYLAHRIAYELHTGEPIPDGLEVDHRDGNRDNNAIANLRLASSGDNAQNRRRRSDNTSGYVGVSWHRQTGKWWAQIGRDGRRLSLGLHDSPDAAHRAYLRAKESFHRFQPIPRKSHGA